MSEKYVLIRPPSEVDDALRSAARKRHLHKVVLIERLLSMIVVDNLIDAVLDDDGSGEWSNNAETRTDGSPTS